MLKKIGVPLSGSVLAEYAGGKRGLTHYGKIKSLHVGSVNVKHIPVSTVDLKPITTSEFDGMDIKGIIGTRFLMHFLSTIDYKNKQLVLRQQREVMQKVFDSQLFSTQNKSIPFYLVESHLMFAHGSFNKRKPALYFIDTGLANGGFLSSKAILEQADVVMDWSKAVMGAGGGGMVKGLDVQINEVSLGSGDNSLTKHDVHGVVTEGDMAIFNGELGFKVDGLISHQFFRGHALSFDFKQMRLIIQ